MGLVEQLQADALDPAGSVTNLLRKVKLAAVKLQLPDVADWVDSELSGYEGDVPEYRRVHGQPKAFNPYRGWIPIGGDGEFVSSLSEVTISESISSIEALVAKSDGSRLYFAFPPRLIEVLNRAQRVNFGDMGNHVSASTLSAIIEKVRNLVLDWALDLERRGINGEGLSFSNHEKDRAKSVAINIGTFSGSLNAGDAIGHQARNNVGSTDNSTNASGSSSVFSGLRTVTQTIRNEADRTELEARIGDLEATYGSPTFPASYARFMELAANHMTVFLPLIPALSGLLAG